MSEGNGENRTPVEVLDLRFSPIREMPRPRKRRPLWPALILFLLTVVSTLAVGSEFARSYAENREPFSGDQNPFAMMALPFRHPSLLALGIPFSFTLLAILLAHELGHYFAGKAYGIDVSYPYFIPAPNFFGTFGAFIRIRSPIPTKRALFDVGLSGPVAGFVLALPALACGIATSKIVPGAEDHADLVFGHPLLVRIFAAVFHANVDVTSVLLNPVARAAWVGLFVTALNLLPVWQLDGGHVLYTLAGRQHRKISIAVSLALIAMGWLTTRGASSPQSFYSLWYVWGVILLVLTLWFRHPPVLDRWQPLDRARRVWAVIGLVIFALSFTPWPVQ
ncbi:MAG TPA: site-2 protease family protein [Verrucomicrobiae bacterium]|nr:site-2 protease family protein [Verrucomicrobiae bacterium]